jgi:hypothetical protein
MGLPIINVSSFASTSRRAISDCTKRSQIAARSAIGTCAHAPCARRAFAVAISVSVALWYGRSTTTLPSIGEIVFSPSVLMNPRTLLHCAHLPSPKCPAITFATTSSTSTTSTSLNRPSYERGLECHSESFYFFSPSRRHSLRTTRRQRKASRLRVNAHCERRANRPTVNAHHRPKPNQQVVAPPRTTSTSSAPIHSDAFRRMRGSTRSNNHATSRVVMRTVDCKALNRGA